MFQHAEPKRGIHEIYEMSDDELEKNLNRVKRRLRDGTLDRNQLDELQELSNEYMQEMDDRLALHKMFDTDDDVGLYYNKDKEDDNYDEGSDINMWSKPRKKYELQELRKRLKTLKSHFVDTRNKKLKAQIEEIRQRIKDIIFSVDDNDTLLDQNETLSDQNEVMLLLNMNSDAILSAYNRKYKSTKASGGIVFSRRSNVSGGVKPLSIDDMRTKLFLDLVGQDKDKGRDTDQQNVFHYMAAKPILDFSHEEIKAYFEQKKEWLSQYDNKGQTPLDVFDMLSHKNKKTLYDMQVLFEKGPRFITLFKQAIASNTIPPKMSKACHLQHWLDIFDEKTKQRNIDIFIYKNTYDKVMITFFIDQCAKINCMFDVKHDRLRHIKPFIEFIMLHQYETSQYVNVAYMLCIVYKATRNIKEYQEKMQEIIKYYKKLENAPRRLSMTSGSSSYRANAQKQPR